MELGSPKPKEGSRGENWARLSWVGSESSQAHIPHTELEKVKLIKLKPWKDVWGIVGLSEADLVS